MQLRGTGAAGAGVGGQAGAERDYAARLPWLRWILVEAAQVATRCSPAANSYSPRLRRKKPARVALARKLLVAVWAMLHHGVVFEKRFLRRGKGNPSARCHPCSSRTTLRWSDGDRTYRMCLEHE